MTTTLAGKHHGDSREYMFQAKTTEGYICKILMNLLQDNLKNNNFEITAQHIRLRQMDSQRHILIDLRLGEDKFAVYKFKSPETLFVGVNATCMYKLIKSTKKKDTLKFFIEKANPHSLGIEVVPMNNNRVSVSHMVIQKTQNLQVDVPTGYGKSVIVAANEFQKTLKDMDQVAKVVTIRAGEFWINLSCAQGSIYSRDVCFGEMDRDDGSTEPEYCEEFYMEQLSRVTKITGLSQNLHVFTRQGLPMRIMSNVGTIGEISIYIKSKRDVEADDEDAGLSADE